MSNHKLLPLIIVTAIASFSQIAQAADNKNPPPPPSQNNSATKEVVINDVTFNVNESYQFFGWDEAATKLKYDRFPVQSFTNEAGQTHYYQVVHIPDGNLNWFQAAYLADDAGGYLASITSEAENDFVFSLVDSPDYFWTFPKYVEGKSQHNHHEISIGPFLGGYQPEGSKEPDGGWSWLSGEQWGYSNWAVNLDDGVIDKDPRPNDQPNDSGNGQRVMGFGEMNQPVPTWGDYMDDVGTYGRDRLPGRAYAFIIEFETMPQ
ncbi:hypothetical protein [Vibrio hippocampi]|uniref:C-type lectin domain-containing protein n=1 Tax=Vibrio hippocampi TaxID=654686 RepID=A0ABN8DNP6_9VIBR|nr:hypothetical protein [Vibrio hippocampi]CAH0529538.1 hypothetical protein VHP8226_03292 [Vibrio hippocampi]